MSLELLFISLQIAVFAVVFSCILIEEDMIFSFYGKTIRKLPDRIAHPLGECAYCFGGQIALWYYVYRVLTLPAEYYFLDHIAFIAITIFIIHLTLFIYERTS